jgi:hypothetical protein
VFRTTGRRNPTREEVVELAPNRRIGYVLLSGLAIRDYRAFIDLEPDDGGGTRIHWYSSIRPALPGTGWLYRLVLRVAVARFAESLAAHA